MSTTSTMAALARVPVRGGELTVATWGSSDPDAPTVLAAHGITGSHLAWTLLARELPDHRFVAPDLRGRGGSRGLPGPYDIRAHAEDLGAVCEALRLAAPTVVGHSMGGFVAAAFAMIHPEHTGALLLVDGGLPFTLPEGLDRTAAVAVILGPAAQRLAMTFASRAAYLDFWRRHPAFATDWSPAVEQYADYDLVEDEAGVLRPATVAAAVAEVSPELFGSETGEAALAQLPRRTTILTAPRGLVDDPPGLYPPAVVERWRATLPAARIVTVDDVNHYTIVMSARGARVVADELRALLR
ncbi:MAG: alpha/beta hydrolase [Labilithrix sp.]|nr:alpha/beta hydrolase [Labilithrix sp.]